MLRGTVHRVRSPSAWVFWVKKEYISWRTREQSGVYKLGLHLDGMFKALKKSSKVLALALARLSAKSAGTVWTDWLRSGRSGEANTMSLPMP